MGLKGAGARLCFREGLIEAQRWMALFTGNDIGEQNGDNYSRAAVARSIWGINAATGIAANNAAVNFPIPSAAWDDSTWAGIMSASAGGDTLLTMAYANNPAAPQAESNVGWAMNALTTGPGSPLGELTIEGFKVCLQGGLVAGIKYLALFEDDPGTSRANELSGGGYQALAVALSQWNVGANDGHATLNEALSYAVATADLPDVMWVGLVSQQIGGNLLWRRTFDNNPPDPEIQDVLRFQANSLRISLAID